MLSRSCVRAARSEDQHGNWSTFVFDVESTQLGRELTSQSIVYDLVTVTIASSWVGPPPVGDSVLPT